MEQYVQLKELLLILFSGVFTVWFGLFLSKKHGQKKVNIEEIDNMFCYQTKDGVLIEKNDTKYLGKELDKICIKVALSVRNSGKVDLERNDLTEPLKIICDKRYIIKKVNVYGGFEGINFETHFDNHSIDIIWNLFKKGDAFNITIIAEVEGLKKEVQQTKKKQVLESSDFFQTAKISIYGKDLKGKTISFYDNIRRSYKQINTLVFLLLFSFLCLVLANEVKSMANLKRLPFLYDIEILNDNPKVITGMELDHDLGDFYFIKDTVTLKVSVKDIEKDVLIKNVYFDKLKQVKYERQQNVFRVVSWGLLIVGLVGFVIFIIVLLVVRKRH